MKIEIDFDSSHEATIKIDGREIKYGYKDGYWSFLSGIKEEEFDTTIGGMVAQKIIEPMIDILQGHMPSYDNPKTGSCWEAWETLDEECANEVYDNMRV